MRHMVCRAFAITLACGVLLAPPAAHAQGSQQPGTQGQVTQEDGALRLRLPTITVTAQKESENIQEAPVSVTAVTAETLQTAGIRSVSEAAQLAPNAFFSEFTARKLSNPRFRGIGASPTNPSVTTYIDGVPQLNANSSSIELVDVDQMEFVRGPQGALFGRNTLGGLINITSSRPSLAGWSGSLSGPYGNFSAGDVRGSVSGPLVADTLGIGLGIGYSGRKGFTTNDTTGNDLDSRSSAFGKVQLLWVPAANWQVRGILSGESAQDGDYALNDLAALRANHYHASRSIEGFTRRGLVAPTLIVSRLGKALELTTTTGWVWWKTRDVTDLDYTAMPLSTRDNRERDLQFTQEVRLASARNAAVSLSNAVALRWQAGASVFAQRYTQDAVNNYSPGVLYAFSPANAEHSPQSSLDDNGVGVYGRGMLTIMERLDVSVGVRGDYEKKTANLQTFFATFDPFLSSKSLRPENTFRDVSPQFTMAYHVLPGKVVYATVARGFKAGGYNAASPAGKEGYQQEHSWNYEAGAKTSWMNERLALNGAFFFIDWQDLQVNLPDPAAPGRFYISNAAGATSKGVEIESNARPLQNLDLFGGIGYTNARFGSGSVSSVGGGTAAVQVNVDGNKLANTPDYTLHAGMQYSRPATEVFTLYGRADLVRYGRYQYDDANTAAQSPYSLANFRVGVRCRGIGFIEGWVRNAFDTFYIPTAFPFDPFVAPSGFIGESGAARTYGVRAGVTF